MVVSTVGPVGKSPKNSTCIAMKDTTKEWSVSSRPLFLYDFFSQSINFSNEIISSSHSAFSRMVSLLHQNFQSRRNCWKQIWYGASSSTNADVRSSYRVACVSLSCHSVSLSCQIMPSLSRQPPCRPGIPGCPGRRPTGRRSRRYLNTPPRTHSAPLCRQYRSWKYISTYVHHSEG